MLKIVAVAGIETIRDKDGHVKKLSSTFLNNVLTVKKDNDDCEVKVIDSRAFLDAPSPMTALWDAISNAFGDRGIDHLFISCHSDWEGLYIFSKVRKELGEEDRYITVNRDWSGLKFNPDATIKLAGCQAGGRFGKKWPECIAQTISNRSGLRVYAFTSRSSQRIRRDGWFEQKPDLGKYVEFTPEKT